MGRRDTLHFPRQTARICHDLARHVIRTGPSSLWIGRAYQADGSEHGTGRAVDIIVSREVGRLPTREEKAAGDLLAAWLTRHARQLHIRHIIWRNRIWKTRYAAQGWQPLPGNRRNTSDRHDDHIHVLHEDDDGSVPDDPITSTTTEGDDMPLTDTDIAKVAAKTVETLLSASYSAGRETFGSRFTETFLAAKEAAANTAPIIRNGPISLRQEVADSKTMLIEQDKRIGQLETKLDRILDLLTPDRAAE